MDQIELRKITMPRSELVKHWPQEWFEKLVTGCFVRVSVGLDDERKPTYRICRIEGVLKDQKVYRVDGDVCDVLLKVAHGKAERTIDFNLVSNGAATVGPVGEKNLTQFTPVRSCSALLSF
jgi:RNA polymerase-associated protein RTF1